MAQVRVEEEIAGDAAAVWNLMSDFGGLKAWNPGMESCELEGEGVGAVRTIVMPGGISLRERLESLDHANKTYSYSIVEAPLPATDYVATVVVSEAAPGRTKIVWSSEFEPAGAAESDLVALFEGIYKGGIQGVANAL